VDRVSICGSDINLYKWNEVAQVIAKLPFTPGHECSGHVVALGPDCPKNVKIGSRVGVENHYYCGECFQCKNDQEHICQKMGQFGHGKQTIYGGFSEYTIVPARYLYVLKTDLDAKLTCLLEPFGVAHHACEEVDVKKDTLLITGAGAIGLCCVAVAKSMQASKIIVTDVVADKLAVAKKMGADIVINSKDEDVIKKVLEATGNDGVGAWIECSGAPVHNIGCKALRKGGRILMLGLPKGPLTFDTPLPDFIFKSITLKTIHGRKIFHTWEQAEKLLAKGKVDITPIITHEYSLDDWQEAMKVLISGAAIKILVDPTKVKKEAAAAASTS